MDNVKDIRSLTGDELRAILRSMGEPAYRSSQVMDRLWHYGVGNFDQITNISVSLRQKLGDRFCIHRAVKSAQKISTDGTRKFAVSFADGCVVEAALIPTPRRITACISSQVGCSLACNFCATGRLKRVRNLEAYELLEQMMLLNSESQKHHKKSITHVVLMGMGEPLLNYRHVLRAMKAISEAKMWQISPKKITLSTVGFPSIIKKLADDYFGFRLAVSLHTVSQKLREEIMPHSQKYTLKDLRDSLLYWYLATKKKISFEYIIWKGINDAKEDVEALVRYCKTIPCKVNLISYNAIAGGQYEGADPEVFDAYVKALKVQGITATIRYSRGSDIDAGCGQLANQLQPF